MKRNTILLALLLAAAACAASAQQKLVPIYETMVGGLIGGVQNGAFVDAKKAAAALKGGESYDLYTMMGHEEGEMTGKKPENDQDVCTDFYYVEMSQKADHGVALGQGIRWNPAPRVAKSLSLTDKTYVKIASDYLKLKGIAKPSVKLTQLYRIDLDGDGVEEVIMSATRYSGEHGATAKTGDYSFTIVRQVVKGKVVNIDLGGDYIKKNVEFGAPNTYFVSAVADLNGDGKMEVISHSSYYEGSGTAVFEITGGKAIEIKALGGACGV